MAINGMRPVHPGEVPREEFLEPLGMSVNALAKELHLTAARINDIVREERGVTAETALRLARYFGTSAQFWVNLQSALSSALRRYGTKRGLRNKFGLWKWHPEMAAS